MLNVPAIPFFVLLPPRSSSCCTCCIHPAPTTAVSPLALSEQNASSVLLVLSDSISKLATNASVSGTTLSAADLLKYIQSTKVTTKELTFGEKGAAAPPATASVPGGKAIPVAKPTAPSSKPGKDSKDALSADPSQIQSLGLTIKKEQEDFGGWYKQVLCCFVAKATWLLRLLGPRLIPRTPGPITIILAATGPHIWRHDRLLRRLWVLHPQACILRHLGGHPAYVICHSRFSGSVLT